MLLLVDQAPYAEVLERVYRAYEVSRDLDVAFAVEKVSAEVRARLVADPDLLARIEVFDANAKQSIVQNILDIARTSESDGVRLTALKDLGNIFYAKRFSNDPPQQLPEQAIPEEVLNDKSKRLSLMRDLSYRRLFELLSEPAKSAAAQRNQARLAILVLQGTGELVTKADLSGKIDLGQVVEGILEKASGSSPNGD